MRKDILLLILLFAIMLAVSACNTNSGNAVADNKNNANGNSAKVKATIFKSQSCGCCGLYASYIDKKGFDVEVVQTDDLDSIKNKFNIPIFMESCHTTVISDYFVEGHVPVEAIQKLLEEKPDIAGISLPGMESGSPGMPGSKKGPFIVYAIDKNGGVSEFMKI